MVCPLGKATVFMGDCAFVDAVGFFKDGIPHSRKRFGRGNLCIGTKHKSAGGEGHES